MTKLVDIAGLPVYFDEHVEVIRFDTGIECASPGYVVHLRDISPSLLNKYLRYPEKVYTTHGGVKLMNHRASWPGDFHYDVFHLPAGLLGIEYMKTHIFMASGDRSQVACVVQVLSGVVTVVIQKNRPKVDIYDFDTHVDELMIIEVGKNERLEIPAGYLYTFINTGMLPAIFARVIITEHVVDYRLLAKENGLGVYFISKNAKPEIVANARYRSIVPIRRCNVQQYMKVMGTGSKSCDGCLYSELISNPDNFSVLYR